MKRREFIGLEVRIKRSICKNQTGLHGIVVDETKNTLVIDVGGKEKTLLKKNCVFLFNRKGRWVEVDGREIIYRPEERTKKVR